jgi:hypothetical protein
MTDELEKKPKMSGDRHPQQLSPAKSQHIYKRKKSVTYCTF